MEDLPILAVRNTVVFPKLLMPISAERPVSLAAVQAAAMSEEKKIFVVTQHNLAVEIPGQQDLHAIGTKAIIKKMVRMPQNVISMALQGIERAVLIKVEQTEPYLKGRIRLAPVPEENSTEIEALTRAVQDLATKAFLMLQPEGNLDLSQLFADNHDPLQLTYVLGSILNLDVEKEQSLLEAPTRLEALRLIHNYLTHEIQVLELRNKITQEAQSEMTKQQRDYLLRQQLRAIQQELGEQEPGGEELTLLKERIDKADLPEDVRKEVSREFEKLKKLPPQAPDYHVSRSYLDLILELPWRKGTEDVIDIARARQVLDEDHYDLEEIKERILEQLGVLKLNPGAKAPILCFVGAPGVGKTSLGQSIARAIGRKFERLSLGGMHDEAELRGHRRTYIGALPGAIIRVIRRAGVNNPVLMLDEVDKLGRDFRGDPAAALLEILDPEQNRTFRDNYLDLPFDLSKVFFITTANTLDSIPPPLLDRMEILRLSGYSEEEKMQIARRYLIPRQLKEAGLSTDQLQIGDAALRDIISHYTREAGVRQLERSIGRVARKTALLIAEGKEKKIQVEPDMLYDFLGVDRFFQEQARQQLPPGVSTGLAWTESGGDVLYIEATLLPKGPTLTLTGHLGEVMQESARAAHSYLWSNAERLGINKSLFQDSGVHIHVPAGAIPKDGPSAGVAMATALASLYLKLPVDSKTAMTGEITLTGLVLPVGGIKEKVLAARRAGIRKVILPKENEKDLRQLPKEVRSELEFVFATHVEEVLKNAIPGIKERPVPAAPVAAS
ncbi:MAG TPA: endopeptidase La [Acidobacteriota bacterium]|nr:endopeptidase La [Acidobacteriota bacterium]